MPAPLQAVAELCCRSSMRSTLARPLLSMRPVPVQYRCCTSRVLVAYACGRRTTWRAGAHPACGSCGDCERCFAPCPRGLRGGARCRRLTRAARRIAQRHAADGGASVAPDRSSLRTARTSSRVSASRILWQVAHGRYRNGTSSTASCTAVDWQRHFVERTLRVDRRRDASPLTSVGVRDAQDQGRRLRSLSRRDRQAPLASTSERPDVRVHAYLTANATRRSTSTPSG